jgi:hypothetical protein
MLTIDAHKYIIIITIITIDNIDNSLAIILYYHQRIVPTLHIQEWYSHQYRVMHIDSHNLLKNQLKITKINR